MGNHACRSCSGQSGHQVLDLGNQPACRPPLPGAPRPGPGPVLSAADVAVLVMRLGAAGRRTHRQAEEPRGAEPEALVGQAVDAVERLAIAGWLSGRSRVVEFASPHGGSWLGLLADQGVSPVTDGGPADLVIDSFGMMHDPDQGAALAERASRVAPGGALLLQYHSLDTIIRLGQWNALRHGHFVYYSTSALVGMLKANGLGPRVAWRFNLYGGTVLLAASREPRPHLTPDASVNTLLSEDARLGVCDPAVFGRLQCHAEAHARGLRDWLVAQRTVGKECTGLRRRVACGGAPV